MGFTYFVIAKFCTIFVRTKRPEKNLQKRKDRLHSLEIGRLVPSWTDVIKHNLTQTF